MSVYKGDKLIVGSVLNTDLTPDIVPTEGSLRHVMSGGVYTAILTKEDIVNKTTVVDANATDDQYPSAKAVYKALGTLEPANIEYASDLYTPDWSHATAISQSALLSGYTALKRGVFVGSTIPNASPGIGLVTVNGFQMGVGYISGGDVRVAYVNTPVAAGDVIKSDMLMVQDGFYKIYFIPYKRQ